MLRWRQTFFSIMVATSGRPPMTLPRSENIKSHRGQTEGCNYINKRRCDKCQGLEWVYSLFSAYASALKSNRRMALLAGSLAHALIFYPHTDMRHTCSAFLNIKGKTRETSSLPSNECLTWVSGTLHRHYHRLEGWIKGRKKINVKHRPNERKETREREKQPI